jgi:voltage-gated potassium channel Kch
LFGGQILIGSAMIVLTVVIHIAGIIGLIAYLKARGLQIVGPRRYVGMMRVLVVTILGIFFAHTAEIWSWAVLYLWLGEFESLERALYFSTVTFTTLGYGDITLQEGWQLLSSLEAVNGVILFGVSTAFVFAVIRKMFEVASIIESEP